MARSVPLFHLVLFRIYKLSSVTLIWNVLAHIRMNCFQCLLIMQTRSLLNASRVVFSLTYWKYWWQYLFVLPRIFLVVVLSFLSYHILSSKDQLLIRSSREVETHSLCKQSEGTPCKNHRSSQLCFKEVMFSCTQHEWSLLGTIRWGEPNAASGLTSPHFLSFCQSPTSSLHS